MITCRCRHRRRRTLILTRCSSVRHFEYFNQNRPPDKPSPAPGPPSRPSPRRATPPPASLPRSRQRTAPRPRSAPARAWRRARAPPLPTAPSRRRGGCRLARAPPTHSSAGCGAQARGCDPFTSGRGLVNVRADGPWRFSCPPSPPGLTHARTYRRSPVRCAGRGGRLRSEAGGGRV